MKYFFALSFAVLNIGMSASTFADTRIDLQPGSNAVILAGESTTVTCGNGAGAAGMCKCTVTEVSTSYMAQIRYNGLTLWMDTWSNSSKEELITALRTCANKAKELGPICN